MNRHISLQISGSGYKNRHWCTDWLLQVGLKLAHWKRRLTLTMLSMPGQSNLQLPLQDLAMGSYQPSPDNDHLVEQQCAWSWLISDSSFAVIYYLARARMNPSPDPAKRVASGFVTLWLCDLPSQAGLRNVQVHYITRTEQNQSIPSDWQHIEDWKQLWPSQISVDW